MLSFFLDRRILRPTAAAVLVAFAMLVLPLPAWQGEARADALADLSTARDHYEFAEFDQGVAMLEKLVSGKQLSGESLRDAYVLLARCQVGKGNEPQALDAFCSAICLDRTWRPDAVFFPQDEIEVFTKALEGCKCGDQAAVPPPVKKDEDKGGGMPKWVYYAGGAVVVGLVAVLAMGGGGDDEPSGPSLPGFPDPPSN